MPAVTLSESNQEERFYPPLYLQRRMWALEVIKREGPRSVLDVGCGEGSLLSVLCLPPTRHDELPEQADPAAEELRRQGQQIHLERLAGLDINAEALAKALEVTRPDAEATVWDSQRWGEKPLHLELWEGGLEKFVSAFVGFDCITALEVIEHLPPHVFDRFGPVILGMYRPRVLAITTPNYSFNARFTPSEEQNGFNDPTGRTDRRFRHDDHKFEWTPAEFEEWCNDMASAYGYTVVVGGIGTWTTPPEDSKAKYVSQTAIFRLLPSHTPSPERSPRSALPTPLAFRPPTPAPPPAKIATHRFEPTASSPLSPAEIRDVVQRSFAGAQQGLSLGGLWDEDVSEAAGGSIRALLAALGGGFGVESHGGEDVWEVADPHGSLIVEELMVRWKGEVTDVAMEWEEKGDEWNEWRETGGDGMHLEWGVAVEGWGTNGERDGAASRGGLRGDSDAIGGDDSG